jgi:hypothetical protein
LQPLVESRYIKRPHTQKIVIKKLNKNYSVNINCLYFYALSLRVYIL